MTLRSSAIRLCEYAASGSGNATIDTLVLHADASADAADLADEACTACLLDAATMGYDWRELWAEAAQRLREGWRP